MPLQRLGPGARQVGIGHDQREPDDQGAQDLVRRQRPLGLEIPERQRAPADRLEIQPQHPQPVARDEREHDQEQEVRQVVDETLPDLQQRVGQQLKQVTEIRRVQGNCASTNCSQK